jgi:hypothetical protein
LAESLNLGADETVIKNDKVYRKVGTDHNGEPKYKDISQEVEERANEMMGTVHKLEIPLYDSV